MVLRRRCIVLCTECKFVSDWYAHVRGWEGDQWQGAEGSDYPGIVQGCTSLLSGGNVYSIVRMASEGKCF